MPLKNFKVMVLYGGPDKERPISIQSSEHIAAALEQCGHEVALRDITPDEKDGNAGLGALDEFISEKFDVAFPALHGKWGEGGDLQAILEQRNISFVGTRAKQAALCMDKVQSKLVFKKHNLPTPEFTVFDGKSDINIAPPAVVKPADEGSSIALTICHSAADIARSCAELCKNYSKILIEKYVPGREITVGILETESGDSSENKAFALPVIEIIPADRFYDYDAKYERNDTKYNFDITLPDSVIQQVNTLAVTAHKILGARHLSRVDFIVDKDNQPWLLEINTMPGFTGHSLLPMAGRQAGIEMPALVDRLVRLVTADKV